MSAAVLAAALVAGAGLSLALVSVLAKARSRELAELLEVQGGFGASAEATAEESRLGRAGPGPDHGRLLRGIAAPVEWAVARFDPKGTLATRLERARVPLRPGEFVGVVALLGALCAAVAGLLTGEVLVAVGVVVASPLVADAVLKRRIAERRRAFEEQLPGALSLIAASLSGGHTFLRAIQLMCEEAEPPLSQEFSRVVTETALGSPLVEALDRMAARMEIRDLSWVVQAVRIQQQVGGKLADVLHTLAGFIRAREEVRREVRALTAEGRLSAFVLAGLPLFLLVAIEVVAPHYLAPLFRGYGILALVLTAASVVVGAVVILRMARIEV